MDNRHRDRDLGDEDQTSLDDPLGIAREPVTKDDRIRASSDKASVRRRRKRAGIGTELQPQSTGQGDLDMDPKGATSIDMGYGGQGNDTE